jgi:hypothetical protein
MSKEQVMRNGWIVAAALIFVSLFVPRAGALAAPGDACTMLTDMQVSKELGVMVGAGSPIGAPTSCQWAGKGKIATLTVNNVISGKTALERFETGKTSKLPGITIEPTSGVGDDAYYVFYSGTTRAGMGLVVKKGKSAFEVRVYGFDNDPAKPVAKSLAQIVAAKL